MCLSLRLVAGLEGLLAKALDQPGASDVDVGEYVVKVTQHVKHKWVGSPGIGSAAGWLLGVTGRFFGRDTGARVCI